MRTKFDSTASSNKLSFSDILSLISLSLFFIGGIITLIQWRGNVALKRASFINDLIEKMRIDADIKETIFCFDYTKPWYNENFHESGELELKVDKTLSFLSYICYLIDHKLITTDEFCFFRFAIERTLKDRQIQDYFYNLYHFTMKLGVPITFTYLFEYGKKNMMFDKEFFDKKSDKYHHFLNF